MNLPERIKYIRTHICGEKFKQEDLANLLGVHLNRIGRYERGETKSIDADICAKICTKFGISPEWLLLGTGPILNQESMVTTSQASSDLVTGTLVGRGNDMANATPAANISYSDVDLIMVPMVEARLSAGTGSLETSGEIEKSYAFRSDFLHRKGNPDRMVLMLVGGDSMQPEIMDKDVVLLDQSKRNIRPGPIFAVGFDESIYLKRIDALPGKIILKSVNPAYPPVELKIGEQEGDSFRIIGQVIWCGREY